jgi:endonuclease III
MINPSKITDYNLTVPQLEEHILWWICAAGKNGTTASKLLDKFMERIGGYTYTPFAAIRMMPSQLLPIILMNCGIGCYTHKARTIVEIAHSGLDLQTCTAEELENIYGIGMKTSRCFILHSREGAQYAGLDTHVLKFLRAEGYAAPKATPPKKKYLELEKIFLEIAKKKNKLPADLDLEIWNAYSIG